MRYLSLLLAGAVASAASAATEPKPVPFREAVEADWLRQDEVRDAAYKAGPTVTSREDAAGAVDGKKDGKWGFHTSEDNPPWWHVNLGAKLPLDRVVVFNRCDGGCPGRNPDIQLLLSDDGKAWQLAYKHNGN